MSDATFSIHPDEYRHYEAVINAARQHRARPSQDSRSLNEAFMLLMSQSTH